ncbi:hypothetical protein OROGR_029593 [Orobanche gracilis]
MVKIATWNDNTTKKLLDICVDKKESGFSNFDWGKIAKNLSVQTEMPFKHRKYANMLVKRGLSNVNELDKLFGGRTAHGERRFSPAMTRTTKVNDLDEGESVGADTEMEIDLNAYSDGDGDVTGKGKSVFILGEESSNPTKKAKNI